MLTTSLTEPGRPLVLRIVGGNYRARLHLCFAHPSIMDGAIVTLEALCTAWAYDTLSHVRIEQWRHYFPDAMMCPACWVKYQWLPA